jgi:phospholipase/carboxylesterase
VKPRVKPDDDWGGLNVVAVELEGDDTPVDTAVVLLHGWGAASDDLLPLADELVIRGSRLFVPEGPLPEVGGGRAWWHLDETRPAHAWDDQLPAGHQPNPEVTAARRLVLALVDRMRARLQPRRLALAGFSQGGMLALDVALAARPPERPPVDRVAVMSGVLLADSLPALHAWDTDEQRAGAPRPPVLISHGRQDEVLRFGGGERAGQVLAGRGFPVTWLPFTGGHEIPTPVMEALRSFLAPSPFTS